MINILVVDDAPVERALAGALLANHADFNVRFAENGQDALQQMCDSVPHLVVTDLIMPEMDGLELVRAVRRQFPQVPVILMTAHGNESLAVNALEQGAASYVPKAKRSEQLVETVRRVLARAQADRQRTKLTKCVGKLDATFYLDNDPQVIPPLVDYIQQMLGGLDLGNEAERIRAGIALEEALVNAQLHGNLELTSAELDEAKAAGPSALRNLIEERRNRPPYCDRGMVVEAHLTSTTARFVIRDGGEGFDLGIAFGDPMSARFENGKVRGTTLMSLLMDQVQYNEIGNQVTLIKTSD